MKKNKDTDTFTTKDSSQIDKQKIFMIKKINLYSLKSSPILNPFIINKKEKSNYDIKNEEYYKIKNKVYDDIIYDNFNLDKMIDEIERMQINKSTYLFHKHFLNFKKMLKIKIDKRKTGIDNFLKKCKSKFSKAFNQMIYKLLKFKRKIYKLPQTFVTDINIDKNKQYLNHSMFQIYEEYNIKIDTDIIIKDCVNKNASYILFNLMNKSYKSLYNDYISSKRYKKDCLLIRKKKRN